MASLVATLGARAQQVGDKVAEFELAAPAATEFTLHGTIPVPPNVFPRADGRSPFRIRSHDGSLVPAQTEIVSRYPDDSKGADVVEVLARVQRSASVPTGEYITFDIVYAPHTDTQPVLEPRVDLMRSQPDTIVMRTRDVFGNLYRSELQLGALGRKTLKNGSALLEERCYDVLRPVQPQSGPQATLPRLMGVHSYFSYWPGEDTIQLDLRVHNATSGADRSSGAVLDDVQCELYFDQLEIVVPKGWTVLSDFPDPSTGQMRVLGPARTMYPLVKAQPNGRYNVIGKQAQFERRVAITREGGEARAKELIEGRFLGYCRAGRSPAGAFLWSWWNVDTARYYPQRHRIPDLGYMGDVSGLNTARGKLNGDYGRLLDFFTVGASMNAYPLHFPRLGWAHPYGVQYGGMTGGSEIYCYDGFVTAYAASWAGYRYTLLRHRMYTDRMPDALFDMNGDPTHVFEWIVNGPSFSYVPCNFYQRQLSGPDMFGFNQAPTHQVAYAQQNGLAPDYEADLLAFKSIDPQHLVRYLNSPKTLAWLANDSVAKDDLWMQAEISRMSYYHLPSSSGGAVMSSQMLSDLNFVAQHPGVGFAFGRGEGWMVDSMCAAYSFADPQWRAQARDWFERIVDMVHDGRVNCTGMIQAIVNTKVLNAAYRARQSIEQAIVENALWSVRETVFRGTDPTRMGKLKRILSESAYSMIGFPGWSVSSSGPYSHVAIGPLSLQQPLFCDVLPDGGSASAGVDKYQSWSTLAYGWELTGDPLFLQRAMEMSGSQFQTFQQAVQSGFNNLENRCALTALADIQYP